MTKYYDSEDNIAEAYVLSTLDNKVSVIGNGSLVGKNLTTIYDDYPSWFNEFRQHFPILIKLADTGDYTSIQVHPNDAYAMGHFHGYGKGEIWYVIDADEGSGVYVGFKEDITKEELLEAIANDTILDKLNFQPVKKGDVVEIDAGNLHTMTKGLTVLAIQENSDVSYRIYDFNRSPDKNRPLDIDKALEVINYNKTENAIVKLPMIISKNKIISKKDFSPYFIFSECEMNNDRICNEDSMIWLISIEGDFSLEYLRMNKYTITPVKEMCGVVIPRGLECKVLGKAKIIKIEI